MQGVLNVRTKIYINGTLLLVKTSAVPEDKLESHIEDTGMWVAMLVMDRYLFMIEFEFLDEPDPKFRFARMGTDPRRMTNPRLMTDGGGKHGAN